MLADAAASLSVADVSVAVAVAGYAAREAAAVVALVAVARGARLAELSDVALGTRAHLDPIGRLAGSVATRRLQLELLEETHT